MCIYMHNLMHMYIFSYMRIKFKNKLKTKTLFKQSES